MSKPKPIPGEMTCNAVCDLVGITGGTGRDAMIRAGMQGSGIIDTRKALRVLYDDQRTKYERVRDPAVRNRKDEAEAQVAEIEAAKAKEEVAPSNLARALCLDYFTKLRQAVIAEDGIAEKVKQKLFAKLAAIKPSKLEDMQ